MPETGRRGSRVAYLIIPGVLVVASLVIFLRHQWPKLITSEDVAIFAAALTLAATITAVRAAQASRDAAQDSRRALQLHFQPGDIRVGFQVRKPNNLNTAMPWTAVPDPAPLWVTLALWAPVQAEYKLVWVDDDGQSHEHYIPVGDMPPDAATEVEPVLLTGIKAREDRSGPVVQTLASVPMLSVYCRDRRVQADWQATLRQPGSTALGSYRLRFELER
jgi:hypothetical protein